MCCNYPKDGDGSTQKPKYKNACTVHVKAGECIQHAIDSATPGSRIFVAAGTYAEQLTISKDGIELIGQNAVIVPPATAITNTCSGLTGPGSQTGICVTGSKINLADFKTEHRKVLSVGNPVKDVSVSGFQVKGFSGINIATLGARNAKVFGNTLTDGKSYGALTLGSIHTIITDNVVSSTTPTFIGICMDNFAEAFVWKNHISQQYIGLCVQTPGASIQYNEVTECCFGAFVDPGIKGAKLRHNHFGPAPKTGCEAVAAGVFLDGSSDTEITDNLIDGQKNGGKAAGVIILDEPCNEPPDQISLSCIVLGHAAVSSDNTVIRNTFRNNDLDIFVNTTGTGNIIQCNECATSVPTNLCAA